MRKVIAFLVTGLIALSMTAASAAPGASVMASQAAEADWLVWEGRDDASWYFAGGLRGVSDGVAFSVGFAGKADCDVTRDSHGTVVTCMGRARGKEVSLEEFEFDPAMSSARLSFEQNGFKHTVVWEGTDSPYAQGAFGGGEGFAGATAGISRGALAGGTVMGRKLPKRSRSVVAFAGLGQGALGMLFTEYGRTVRIDDNGIVHLRATFRLER